MAEALSLNHRRDPSQARQYTSRSNTLPQPALPPVLPSDLYHGQVECATSSEPWHSLPSGTRPAQHDSLMANGSRSSLEPILGPEVGSFDAMGQLQGVFPPITGSRHSSDQYGYAVQRDTDHLDKISPIQETFRLPTQSQHHQPHIDTSNSSYASFSQSSSESLHEYFPRPVSDRIETRGNSAITQDPRFISQNGGPTPTFFPPAFVESPRGVHTVSVHGIPGRFEPPNQPQSRQVTLHSSSGRPTRPMQSNSAFEPVTPNARTNKLTRFESSSSNPPETLSIARALAWKHASKNTRKNRSKSGQGDPLPYEHLLEVLKDRNHVSIHVSSPSCLTGFDSIPGLSDRRCEFYETTLDQRQNGI
jgi:hypothetical protein